MEITKKYVSTLNEIEKEQIFNMYRMSYSLSGKKCGSIILKNYLQDILVL